MKRSFQSYVHGEIRGSFRTITYVSTKTMKELRQAEQEMERVKDRLSQLKARTRRRTLPSERPRRFSA